MNISQIELISMVKELDNLLPVPETPEDYSTPVDFGTTGIVVMCDSGTPMVITTFDEPTEMFGNQEVSIFANGFGHVFVVAYGGAMNADTEEAHVARVIFGLTCDGLQTSLMRFLDTDEIMCDENGEGEGGSIQQELRRLFD
jgi:hypothetical protein